MKAIILVRVSTKEQEEGHSINAQKMRLVEYCQRRDLPILRVFEIIESSTRGDRREFKAMLEFARQQPSMIAVVADAVDRVQRSFKESTYLDELVRAGKIELHFYREGRIIGQNASAMDIMCWDFAVMGAKSYVLQLSENVKRSIEWKLRNGEFPHQAPIGYMNIRDQFNKSQIVPDPARAPLIREMFELYSSGAYSIEAVTAHMRKKGLQSRHGKEGKLANSHVHKMLQNPFYYGVMVVKEKAYNHKYEPLISKALFDECERVRLGWKKKPVKLCKTESALRGLVRCATTGAVITPDPKTKHYRNTKRTVTYHYLRVPRPDNPNRKIYVSEEEVLEQIAAVFRRIRMPEDIYEEVKRGLLQANEAEKRYHVEALKALQREETELQAKLDRLMDHLLAERISVEDHDRKRMQLKQRQIEVNEELRIHHEADNKYRETVSSVLRLAYEAHDLFVSSSAAQKRQFISMMFSNLRLNGRTLCYEIRKPFDKFIGLTTHQEWRALVDDLRTSPEILPFIKSQHYQGFLQAA